MAGRSWLGTEDCFITFAITDNLFYRLQTTDDRLKPPPATQASLLALRAGKTYLLSLDFTLIDLGLADSALGMVRVRTPSSVSASTLAASTAAGRVTERAKVP